MKHFGRRCLAPVGLAAAIVAGPALAQSLHPRFAGTPQRPAPSPLHATPGAADAKPDATAAPTEAQAKAQQHFRRAKELYEAGSYREAVTELEAARALDPHAKDLVWNLGFVSEKLGRFDDALRYFRIYTEMDGVTAAERARADGFIKRLEGAKREVPAATASVASSAAAPSPAPRTPDSPPRGRIDAATITAASFALVGFGVGAAFGVKAMSDRPASFTTGRDGTYADLVDRTDSAHTEAIVSDVGFGVGIVATVVTAILYFSRTDSPRAPKAKSGGASSAPVVGAAASPGGGAVWLGGSFE